MGKTSLSRGEIVFCGFLLLVAVGFGVYRLNQEIYDAQEPQIFEEATKTVAPREVLALTYREIGKECNYVPWDGTVQMSIRRAVLYPSYGDACANEDNVSSPNGILHDARAPFLVVEVDVTNVDAEERDFWWGREDVSSCDGAITLSDVFSLYSEEAFNDYGCYLASVLWCVDGEASAEYGNSVDVPQGSSVCVTLGFSLEDGAQERLEGATLLYESFFDRMSIGVPELGGREYASVSQ